MKRIYGLQYPLSWQQILSILGFIITVISTFILIIYEVKDSYDKKCLLIIESICAGLVTCCWLIIELNNPEDKHFSLLKDINSKRSHPSTKWNCWYQEKSMESTKTNYCCQCGKYVLGLDHHCMWLNTCIGSKNYEIFISLILSCCFLFGFQTIFGFVVQILFVASVDRISNLRLAFGHEVWAFYLLTSVCTLLSFGMFCSFLMLLSFHLYLMLYKKMTTYDWILESRKIDSTVTPTITQRLRDGNVQAMQKVEFHKEQKMVLEKQLSVVRESQRSQNSITSKELLKAQKSISLFQRIGSTLSHYSAVHPAESSIRSFRSSGSNQSSLRIDAGSFHSTNIHENLELDNSFRQGTELHSSIDESRDAATSIEIIESQNEII